jgi:Protein of unknown function (DUF3145)
MTGARTNYGDRAAKSTRGVVFIHCCPAALGPHVEWAIAGVLGLPVKLSWTSQPAAPATLRSDATWIGPVGTAARIAAALRSWPMLVFEVTEEATAVSDGERLAFVPGRGFHRSMVAANGDVVVGEERVRALLNRARSADDFAHGLNELLGSAWDAELEPYRQAGDGVPISLLHKVV